MLLYILQGFKKIQVIERAQVYDWDHYLQCPKGSNSKSWWLRAMVLVFWTSYHSNIHLHSFKKISQFTSYQNHYFQYSKGHNSKSRLSRVSFLMFCSSSHDALHLLEVLSNCFQLTELIWVHGRNGHFQYLLFSKSRNSKSRWPELQLCSAHPLMKLYIFEKFHENIQITEQTEVHDRNGYVQCSKGNNSKSRQTRVTVHEFCTLSHVA